VLLARLPLVGPETTLLKFLRLTAQIGLK
jgi:hypothetical protein